MNETISTFNLALFSAGKVEVVVLRPYISPPPPPTPSPTPTPNPSPPPSLNSTPSPNIPECGGISTVNANYSCVNGIVLVNNSLVVQSCTTCPISSNIFSF